MFTKFSERINIRRMKHSYIKYIISMYKGIDSKTILNNRSLHFVSKVGRLLVSIQRADRRSSVAPATAGRRWMLRASRCKQELSIGTQGARAPRCELGRTYVFTTFISLRGALKSLSDRHPRDFILRDS